MSALEMLESRRLLAAHITVHPNESIQAAIDAAAPGTEIRIQPGVYAESVVVDKANIHLVGLRHGNQGVMLINPGSADDGIRATDAADGFSVENVAVRDFEENGVILV